MAPTQLNWLIGHTVRCYLGTRVTTCAGIVSPSAFHVLASALGGSFGPARAAKSLHLTDGAQVTYGDFVALLVTEKAE
jgi:hypothetical protein